ncbi:DUF6712 family protein [Flavobacterium denitrificans]|uniref:DUF6712 family protein n=1 Tax=Flavobacterium denitrificans TaxID=281361 RepID=UPI0003FDFDB8|nr:DUF6712 family protein [Flavobacterium denitrificans]
MKLLFKTGNDGNAELKQLLGFINADLKIDNMMADIRTATKEVIKLIGKEVYDLAVEAYEETASSEENKEFVDAVRYPIAVNAYRLIAPSNDLAHTNNGRKMKQDDSEKLPFEWMLDRDNKSLERRYYRGLDDLIDFLDNSEENDELYITWTDSDAFKKTNELFIRTVDEFDEFFPIKSRLLLIKLEPGISNCEQYEIKPRVGKDKMNALKESLKENDEITDETDLELLRLIRKASVAYSMAWSMPRLSVQLYPEGVLQFAVSDQTTTQVKKPSVKSEVEAARQAFANDAEKVFIEIENLLSPDPEPIINCNNSILPEIISGNNFMST